MASPSHHHPSSEVRHKTEKSNSLTKGNNMISSISNPDECANGSNLSTSKHATGEARIKTSAEDFEIISCDGCNKVIDDIKSAVSCSECFDFDLCKDCRLSAGAHHTRKT